MQWPFLQIYLLQSSTDSTSNQHGNRSAQSPHQYEERTHYDQPIHLRLCSTWLASCLWSYLLKSNVGYYVTCSLHPHPNLAQNSISASDPLRGWQQQYSEILDTDFSTLWVGHLYKLHKFLLIKTRSLYLHSWTYQTSFESATSSWYGIWSLKCLVWPSIMHTLQPLP